VFIRLQNFSNAHYTMTCALNVRNYYFLDGVVCSFVNVVDCADPLYRRDKLLQSVVYKLVPGLLQSKRPFAFC